MSSSNQTNGYDFQQLEGCSQYSVVPVTEFAQKILQKPENTLYFGGLILPVQEVLGATTLRLNTEDTAVSQ